MAMADACQSCSGTGQLSERTCAAWCSEPAFVAVSSGLPQRSQSPTWNIGHIAIVGRRHDQHSSGRPPARSRVPQRSFHVGGAQSMRDAPLSVRHGLHVLRPAACTMGSQGVPDISCFWRLGLAAVSVLSIRRLQHAVRGQLVLVCQPCHSSSDFMSILHLGTRLSIAQLAPVSTIAEKAAAWQFLASSSVSPGLQVAMTAACKVPTIQGMPGSETHLHEHACCRLHCLGSLDTVHPVRRPTA